jgi:signal transduction histidine kinase
VSYKDLLKNLILKRVSRLEQAMERLAALENGDPVRLDIDRRDEIGRLYEYFNDMSRRLHTYRADLEVLVETKTVQSHKLESLNRELAQRYAERTEALLAAEKANQAKSLFLANMSHELRTPMHGILSFARFGQQKTGSAPNEKIKSYFDEISESGSRLMALLNDLLDLSKLEAGKVTYDLRALDIADVLRSVATEMDAFAEEKGRVIHLDLPQQPLIADFDREKLSQVLRNLLTNAIKFSFDASTIRLSAEEVGSELRCTVSNDGPGIPTNELETIFNKFVQSSKTRNGSGGTGLGLAICREIIHQHGGKIWAESAPGEPTRFILQIPKNAQAAAA